MRILIVLGVMCLIYFVSASATILIVPDEYPSIESAFLEAYPGDSVGIMPGTYQSSAIIPAGVTVLGLGEYYRDVEVYPSESYQPVFKTSDLTGAIVIENLSIMAFNGTNLVSNYNKDLTIQECYLLTSYDTEIPLIMISTRWGMKILNSEIFVDVWVGSIFYTIHPIHILIQDCIVDFGGMNYIENMPDDMIVEYRNNTFLREPACYCVWNPCAYTFIAVNNILPRIAGVGGSEHPGMDIELRYNDFTEELPSPDIGYQIGNISEDPLFCDEDSDDYRLTPESPCVGAGENGDHMGARIGFCYQGAVDENSSDPAIKVHMFAPSPNPSLGLVAIHAELPIGVSATLEVVDVTGRVVWSEQPTNVNGAILSTWRGELLDGTIAPAGIYFVRLTSRYGAVSRSVSIVR